MSRFSGILFDKDGTLFGFTDTWAVWAGRFLDELAGGDAALAKVLGARVGFDMKTRSFERDSIVIAGMPYDIATELHPALPDRSHADILSRMNALAAEVPVAEATPLRPLLEDLAKRGLKLGVATNDAEIPARANLDQVGITGHFDYIAGSDSGYGGKPDPGMLLAFARDFGLAPETVVMVGDSTHDLVAGRAAGMATVAVLTGIATADELAPHADCVMPDIGHLPRWLDEVV